MYKKAKYLIGKNRLQEALAELEIQLKADPRLYELLFQSGRHESLLSQTRKGLLKYEEASLTENQIRNALLELIKDLETEPVILVRKRRYRLTMGIAGVLIVSIVIFVIIRLIPEPTSTTEIQLEDVSVETKGDRSPAVISNEPVNINYGVEAQAPTTEKPESEKSEKTRMDLRKLKLKTEGQQSPAIITQDEVIVNYGDTDWESSKHDSISVDSL